MSSKRADEPILPAPSAREGTALRFPPSDSFSKAFPPVDEHLVRPEVTRDEIIRGRKVIAQPALEPHGDKHSDINFVIHPHVRPGYIVSVDLITRVAEGSDFATDVSIRQAGKDPSTGRRYLEEVSFEVVNEQSMRDVRDKAEDLRTRGVRRVFAVFVKKGLVSEWLPEKGAFVSLDSAGVIEDPCFIRPIPVRALLDAFEAENEVARGLRAKGNPVIRAIEEEGRNEGRRAVLLRLLRMRFGELPEKTLARVRAAGVVTLDEWAERLLAARSLDDVFGEG